MSRAYIGLSHHDAFGLSGWRLRGVGGGVDESVEYVRVVVGNVCVYTRI